MPVYSKQGDGVGAQHAGIQKYHWRTTRWPMCQYSVADIPDARLISNFDS